MATIAVSPIRAQELEVSGGLPPRIEATREQHFTAGLRYATEYDDNVFGSRQDPLHDFRSIVEPSFSLVGSSARRQWELNYRPRLSFDHRLNAYSSASQSLDGNFSHDFTRRLELNVSGSYERSSNPFDRLRTSHDLNSGLTQGPHSVLPFANTTGGSGDLELKYKLTRHSTVGVRGEFGQIKYDSVPSSSSILQSSRRVAGGDLYYSRRLTPRQYAATRYQIRQLWFPLDEGILTHRIQYVHTVVISSGMNFSAFVGPESSSISTTNAGLARNQRLWSYSGGGEFTFRTGPVNVGLSAKREVNASNIDLSASRSAVGAVSLDFDLSKNWSVSNSFEISDSEPLLDHSLSTRYMSATAAIGRRLGKNLLLDFTYWRIQQLGPSQVSGLLVADHNRASVSISYEFSRPWMR